jgi:hypothetical protein
MRFSLFELGGSATGVLITGKCLGSILSVRSQACAGTVGKAVLFFVPRMQPFANGSKLGLARDTSQ